MMTIVLVIQQRVTVHQIPDVETVLTTTGPGIQKVDSGQKGAAGAVMMIAQEITKDDSDQKVEEEADLMMISKGNQKDGSDQNGEEEVRMTDAGLPEVSVILHHQMAEGHPVLQEMDADHHQ